MKNLKFNRLLLLSNSQKSANLFKFGKKYNLITGVDNSIGKSTLVKAMLWTLGCEPKFDDTWKSLDCSAIIEFSIETDNYSIHRYHSMVKVFKNGEFIEDYTKITGEYSEFFADMVAFYALLPNRPAANEEPELETPPPAYYFLPFYIDQISSWSQLWNGFENLGQYSRWKPTIIKSHSGYLSPEHFSLEEDIYEYKSLKEQADNEIKRIDTALEVVEEYTPKTDFSIDEGELKAITAEVEDELTELAKEQEIVLDKIANITSELYYLQSQHTLIETAISDTEKDYVFAVENTDGEEIECPVCGTHHDNTIIDRAGILADKQQLEKQEHSLAKDLRNNGNTLNEYNERLSVLKEKIKIINEKYSIDDSNGNSFGLSSIVESLASKAVQHNVNQTKKNKQVESKNASDQQKKLKKEQGNLLTKEEKQERNEYFLATLAEYLRLLGAQGINLDGIKSPLSHGKLISNGGAAECTRAVLAYQMTVLNMANRFGSSIFSPFIIDTPNQHEQANINYQSIIKLIMEKAPGDQQIFLCAMESPLLSDYEEQANVITLDAQNKLLKKDNYEQLKKEFDKFLQGV